MWGAFHVGEGKGWYLEMKFLVYFKIEGIVAIFSHREGYV